jgi:hypothetical protein
MEEPIILSDDDDIFVSYQGKIIRQQNLSGKESSDIQKKAQNLILPHMLGMD